MGPDVAQPRSPGGGWAATPVQVSTVRLKVTGSQAHPERMA
ncbi:hypothetical protein [Mycolicibacterium sediminis]|nr:hypothetical protein [Mycolicibacterium sediminis]